MAFLYLAHAGVALALIGVGRLPRRARGETAAVLCLAGAVVGVAMAFASGQEWRTTRLDEASALIVAGAIASAWVLAAVLGPAWERWRTGALVGVAATGLALFSANEWVVPALVFWLAAGAATGVLLARPRAQAGAAAWVVAAQVAVAAGVAGSALEAESWTLTGPLTGWPRWTVLAGAIALAGAVPRLGIWQSLRSPAGAAVPIATGGAFVVVHRFVGGPLPWVGVGLLAVGIGVLGWSLRGRALAAAVVGAWPVLLMLAAVTISPATAGRAGLAAALAVSLVALWPASAGRARIPRGLALAFLPPFVGFGVVLSAAVVAFDRASGAPTSLRSAPWTGASAILPLAVAGGTLLALAMALQTRAAARERDPGLATWALAAAALVTGFFEPGGFLAPSGTRLLYGIAAVVGLAAFYGSIAVRHEDEIGPIAEGPDATEFAAGLTSPSARAERALLWTAAALAIVGTAGIGWLTFEGLRNGFLS